MNRNRLARLAWPLTLWALAACIAPAWGDPPPRETPRTLGNRPLLGELLEQVPDSESKFIANLPRMKVDDAKAAAAGLRKIVGRRLVLYTDLPSSAEIDRLPGLFDQAFPQWCEYFGVDEAQHADWRMTGFLMHEKGLYVRGGFLPGDLPPFPHGYARNYELWLYEQPSDYYRRHLLLHEGTHGFMNTILGACGPPWYMEGIAELLGTHRLQDGRVTLNHMPQSKEEVAYWGRVLIVKEAVAQRRPLRLKQVIDYPPCAHRDTEPYAWCWAAATLMDRHPRYRERFRGLYKNVLAPDFTQRFYRAFEDDWDELCEEWQVFVTSLEYGHDVPRAAVEFAAGKPMEDSPTVVTVAVDRGWQSTAVQLQSGVTYRLKATGRYQVADEPQTWWSEPNGVSIRYCQGRPVGLLLAAIRPDQPASGAASGLLRAGVIGLGTSITPKQTGTLYLKINESAAELHDNAGELQVEIVAP